MLRNLWILLAAMALLTAPLGCPGDDDDAADDDTGDDDTGDDDTGDDDTGDDDTASPDADGDGFTVADGDCDDSDPDIHPDATEYCYDGVDNDCSGDADLDDAEGCPLNDEEIVINGDGATLTIPVGAIYGEVPLALAEVAPAEPIPGVYHDLGVTFGVEPYELPLLEPATLEIPVTRGSILCTPIGLYLPYLAAVLWELQPWVTVEQIGDSWVLTFDAFGIFAVVVDALGVDDDGDLYCEGPMACCDAGVDPGDCDDLDPTVNPAADEVCDTVDNDCDFATDEDDAVDASTWYADTDGDGYGDPDVDQTSCAPPTGYVADNSDCDDADADSNPGEVEICDGADNDCNGSIDEGLLIDFYPDADGDGYGDEDATPVQACTAPSDHVADGTDCDDADADFHPGAGEICDSLDNDCDGDVDEGLDVDLDGDGYSPCDGDCDDDIAACGDECFPGGQGETWWCDGWDNDCDGLDIVGTPFADGAEIDNDGDGYIDCDPYTGNDPAIIGVNDCDDTDPAIHPGATEIPDDGQIDENCDAYAPCASLDCDGYADVVAVVTHNGSTHEHDSVIYFGGPQGWGADTLGVPTVHGFDMVAADLDGDEHLDLVFANYLTPAGGFEGVSYIYWSDDQNPGAYSDADRTEVPTKGARGVEAGDLDGDGYVDLVFSSLRDDVGWDSDARVYWGGPVNSWFANQQYTELPVRESMESAITDVDGDGDPDLVFAQGPNYEGRIYWNDPSYNPPHLFDASNFTDLPQAYDCTGVRAHDLDEDGDPDLVFTSIATPALSPVLHNDGQGNFSIDVALSTTNTRSVVVVDVHGDGNRDLAFANYGSYVSGQVFWDAGGGVYSNASQTTLSSNSLRVAGGDIDQDGYDDLAFTGGLGDAVDVYLGSAGGFQPQDSFQLYLGYYSICGVTFVGEGIPAAVWNPNP